MAPKDFMAEGLIKFFSDVIGGAFVLTGEAAQPYCSDWRGRYSGQALAVLFPSDTQQVAALVERCAAQGVAVVPQGGNTGLCGAGVPLAQGAQVVINMSRMNRIREIDAVNYTMTVESGCTLSEVRNAAENNHRLFPLALTAVAEHCQIGGNLSTNAGGIGVLRYGNARDLVLGLEVVLPDGRVWNGLRSLRKDNTGYDLKHLFIGAEGTLGIITAAVLKLFPRPRTSVTACIAIADPDAAVRLLAHIRADCGDTLSGFEIISRSCLELVFKHIPDTAEPFERRYAWYLLVQLGDVLDSPLENALRSSLQNFTANILEFVTTSDVDAAERYWKLRKNISAAQKSEGISIKHDVSVPISRVAEFITRADALLNRAFPGIRIAAFGHMGDGNIHYNCAMPDPAQNRIFIDRHEAAVNELVYQVVDELAGSISAEHGLGQLKRETIRAHKTPLELELMLGIKRVLDPGGLMNPGKVL